MSKDRKPKVVGRIGPDRPCLLSREQFLAIGRPEGYRVVVADFLTDVRAGHIPRTAAVEQLAEVFDRLLTDKLGSCEIDKALNLRERRGRRSGAALDEGKHLTIARFVRDRMQARSGRRGAREEAITAAAVHFKRDERTIEKACERAQPDLDLEPLIDEFLHQSRIGSDLIRQYVSENELKGGMGRLPWRTVVEIARSRAAKNGGA